MTMEPNRDAERVPHVDITMSGITGEHPRVIAMPAAAMPAVAMPAVTMPAVTMQRVLSFDEFYRSNRTPVARALAITLRDADLAGEAIDEAMARAYQRWSHVSQLDNPGGWVYRVALNWSRSVIRRLRRPAPIWFAPSNANAATSAPPMYDPAIDRALEQLTVDQRAVVVCRLLLGWSELQTAASLNIKRGTVKSRLHRAIERLTPLLAPIAAPLEETP
jgi:RNA polymerase sigma-70 factor (ECF subfamily)